MLPFAPIDVSDLIAKTPTTDTSRKSSLESGGANSNAGSSMAGGGNAQTQQSSRSVIPPLAGSSLPSRPPAPVGFVPATAKFTTCTNTSDPSSKTPSRESSSGGSSTPSSTQGGRVGMVTFAPIPTGIPHSKSLSRRNTPDSITPAQLTTTAGFPFSTRQSETPGGAYHHEQANSANMSSLLNCRPNIFNDPDEPPTTPKDEEEQQLLTLSPVTMSQEETTNSPNGTGFTPSPTSQTTSTTPRAAVALSSASPSSSTPSSNMVLFAPIVDLEQLMGQVTSGNFVQNGQQCATSIATTIPSSSTSRLVASHPPKQHHQSSPPSLKQGTATPKTPPRLSSESSSVAGVPSFISDGPVAIVLMGSKSSAPAIDTTQNSQRGQSSSVAAQKTTDHGNVPPKTVQQRPSDSASPSHMAAAAATVNPSSSPAMLCDSGSYQQMLLQYPFIGASPLTSTPAESVRRFLLHSSSSATPSDPNGPPCVPGRSASAFEGNSTNATTVDHMSGSQSTSGLVEWPMEGAVPTLEQQTPPYRNHTHQQQAGRHSSPKSLQSRPSHTSRRSEKPHRGNHHHDDAQRNPERLLDTTGETANYSDDESAVGRRASNTASPGFESGSINPGVPQPILHDACGPVIGRPPLTGHTPPSLRSSDASSSSAASRESISRRPSSRRYQHHVQHFDPYQHHFHHQHFYPPYAPFLPYLGGGNYYGYPPTHREHQRAEAEVGGRRKSSSPEASKTSQGSALTPTVGPYPYPIPTTPAGGFPPTAMSPYAFMHQPVYPVGYSYANGPGVFQCGVAAPITERELLLLRQLEAATGPSGLHHQRGKSAPPGTNSKDEDVPSFVVHPRRHRSLPPYATQPQSPGTQGDQEALQTATTSSNSGMSCISTGRVAPPPPPRAGLMSDYWMMDGLVTEPSSDSMGSAGLAYPHHHLYHRNSTLVGSSSNTNRASGSTNLEGSSNRQVHRSNSPLNKSVGGLAGSNRFSEASSCTVASVAALNSTMTPNQLLAANGDVHKSEVGSADDSHAAWKSHRGESSLTTTLSQLARPLTSTRRQNNPKSESNESSSQRTPSSAAVSASATDEIFRDDIRKALLRYPRVDSDATSNASSQSRWGRSNQSYVENLESPTSAPSFMHSSQQSLPEQDALARKTSISTTTQSARHDASVLQFVRASSVATKLPTSGHYSWFSTAASQLSLPPTLSTFDPTAPLKKQGHIAASRPLPPGRPPLDGEGSRWLLFRGLHSQYTKVGDASETFEGERIVEAVAEGATTYVEHALRVAKWTGCDLDGERTQRRKQISFEHLINMLTATATMLCAFCALYSSPPENHALRVDEELLRFTNLLVMGLCRAILSVKDISSGGVSASVVAGKDITSTIEWNVMRAALGACLLELSAKSILTVNTFPTTAPSNGNGETGLVSTSSSSEMLCDATCDTERRAATRALAAVTEIVQILASAPHASRVLLQETTFTFLELTVVTTKIDVSQQMTTKRRLIAPNFTNWVSNLSAKMSATSGLVSCRITATVERLAKKIPDAFPEGTSTSTMLTLCSALVSCVVAVIVAFVGASVVFLVAAVMCLPAGVSIIRSQHMAINRLVACGQTHHISSESGEAPAMSRAERIGSLIRAALKSPPVETPAKRIAESKLSAPEVVSDLVVLAVRFLAATKDIGDNHSPVRSLLELLCTPPNATCSHFGIFEMAEAATAEEESPHQISPPRTVNSPPPIGENKDNKDGAPAPTQRPPNEGGPSSSVNTQAASRNDALSPVMIVIPPPPTPPPTQGRLSAGIAQNRATGELFTVMSGGAVCGEGELILHIEDKDVAAKEAALFRRHQQELQQEMRVYEKAAEEWRAKYAAFSSTTTTTKSRNAFSQPPIHPTASIIAGSANQNNNSGLGAESVFVSNMTVFTTTSTTNASTLSKSLPDNSGNLWSGLQLADSTNIPGAGGGNTPWRSHTFGSSPAGLDGWSQGGSYLAESGNPQVQFSLPPLASQSYKRTLSSEILLPSGGADSGRKTLVSNTALPDDLLQAVRSNESGGNPANESTVTTPSARTPTTPSKQQSLLQLYDTSSSTTASQPNDSTTNRNPATPTPSDRGPQNNSTSLSFTRGTHFTVPAHARFATPPASPPLSGASASSSNPQNTLGSFGAYHQLLPLLGGSGSGLPQPSTKFSRAITTVAHGMASDSNIPSISTMSSAQGGQSITKPNVSDSTSTTTLTVSNSSPASLRAYTPQAHAGANTVGASEAPTSPHSYNTSTTATTSTMPFASSSVHSGTGSKTQQRSKQQQSLGSSVMSASPTATVLVRSMLAELHNHTPMFTVNSRGTLTSWNWRMEDLTGFWKTDVVGKSLYTLLGSEGNRKQREEGGEDESANEDANQDGSEVTESSSGDGEEGRGVSSGEMENNVKVSASTSGSSDIVTNDGSPLSPPSTRTNKNDENPSNTSSLAVGDLCVKKPKSFGRQSKDAENASRCGPSPINMKRIPKSNHKKIKEVIKATMLDQFLGVPLSSVRFITKRSSVSNGFEMNLRPFPLKTLRGGTVGVLFVGTLSPSQTLQEGVDHLMSVHDKLTEVAASVVALQELMNQLNTHNTTPPPQQLQQSAALQSPTPSRLSGSVRRPLSSSTHSISANASPSVFPGKSTFQSVLVPSGFGDTEERGMRTLSTEDLPLPGESLRTSDEGISGSYMPTHAALMSSLSNQHLLASLSTAGAATRRRVGAAGSTKVLLSTGSIAVGDDTSQPPTSPIAPLQQFMGTTTTSNIKVCPPSAFDPSSLQPVPSSSFQVGADERGPFGSFSMGSGEHLSEMHRLHEGSTVQSGELVHDVNIYSQPLSPRGDGNNTNSPFALFSILPVDENEASTKSALTTAGQTPPQGHLAPQQQQPAEDSEKGCTAVASAARGASTQHHRTADLLSKRSVRGGGASAFTGSHLQASMGDGDLLFGSTAQFPTAMANASAQQMNVARQRWFTSSTASLSDFKQIHLGMTTTSTSPFSGHQAPQPLSSSANARLQQAVLSAQALTRNLITSLSNDILKVATQLNNDIGLYAPLSFEDILNESGANSNDNEEGVGEEIPGTSTGIMSSSMRFVFGGHSADMPSATGSLNIEGGLDTVDMSKSFLPISSVQGILHSRSVNVAGVASATSQNGVFTKFDNSMVRHRASVISGHFDESKLLPAKEGGTHPLITTSFNANFSSRRRGGDGHDPTASSYAPLLRRSLPVEINLQRTIGRLLASHLSKGRQIALSIDKVVPSAVPIGEDGLTFVLNEAITFYTTWAKGVRLRVGVDAGQTVGNHKRSGGVKKGQEQQHPARSMGSFGSADRLQSAPLVPASLVISIIPTDSTSTVEARMMAATAGPGMLGHCQRWVPSTVAKDNVRKMRALLMRAPHKGVTLYFLGAAGVDAARRKRLEKAANAKHKQREDAEKKKRASQIVDDDNDDGSPKQSLFSIEPAKPNVSDSDEEAEENGHGKETAIATAAVAHHAANTRCNVVVCDDDPVTNSVVRNLIWKKRHMLFFVDTLLSLEDALDGVDVLFLRLNRTSGGSINLEGGGVVGVTALQLMEPARQSDSNNDNAVKGLACSTAASEQFLMRLISKRPQLFIVLVAPLEGWEYMYENLHTRPNRSPEAFGERLWTLAQPVTERSLSRGLHAATDFVQMKREKDRKLNEIKQIFTTTKNSPWVRGKLLGRGSFAKVYEAFNELTKGKMAVRCLTISRQGTPEDVDRRIEDTMSEIKLMSELEHKNIISYIYCEKEGNTINIFTEFASKGSLRKVLDKRGPPSLHVAAGWLRDVLEGLQYLHEEGIVHLDLKAANVLVVDDGTCKLADFGTSKRLIKEAVGIVASTDAVKKKGKKQNDQQFQSLSSIPATRGNDAAQNQSIGGTLHFMAPEILDQCPSYNWRADIWSLGCLVVELLTARLPFPHAGSPLAVVGYVSSLKQGDEVLLPPSITDKDAQGFIRACLQVDPEVRPSAQTLLSHPFVVMNCHRATTLNSPPTVEPQAAAPAAAVVAVAPSDKPVPPPPITTTPPRAPVLIHANGFLNGSANNGENEQRSTSNSSDATPRLTSPKVNSYYARNSSIGAASSSAFNSSMNEPPILDIPPREHSRSEAKDTAHHDPRSLSATTATYSAFGENSTLDKQHELIGLDLSPQLHSSLTSLNSQRPVPVQHHHQQRSSVMVPPPFNVLSNLANLPHAISDSILTEGSHSGHHSPSGSGPLSQGMGVGAPAWRRHETSPTSANERVAHPTPNVSGSPLCDVSEDTALMTTNNSAPATSTPEEDPLMVALTEFDLPLAFHPHPKK